MGNDAADTRDPPGSDPPANGAERPAPLEWIVGGVSALAVAAMAGFLLWEAAGGDRSPPVLQVVAGPVAAAGEGYRIAFRVRNDGEAAAAAVVIEGELRSGERVVETSTVTIDYIAGNSERGGGLVFAADPARHTLRIRATGYADP